MRRLVFVACRNCTDLVFKGATHEVAHDRLRRLHSSASAIAPGNALDAHSLSAARAYIVQSERKWVATNPDEVALVKRIVADDYVWIDDGKVLYKAGALRDAAAGPGDVISERVDSLNLRFFADSAVVDGASTSLHKDGRKTHAVFMDTWVLRSGQWRIVASADVSVPHKT